MIKFIGIDQKHRPTRTSAEGGLIIFMLAGLMAVIAAISIALFVSMSNAKAATIEANALRGELVQNLAISPDAADYMHKQGSGLIFDDMSAE